MFFLTFSEKIRKTWKNLQQGCRIGNLREQKKFKRNFERVRNAFYVSGWKFRVKSFGWN